MSVTAIPSELLRDLPEEMQGFEPMAVICNIFPGMQMPIIQNYGIYHINVPKAGERFALTQVRWARMYMDKGDSIFNMVRGPHVKGEPVRDNRIAMIQGARQIAEDLCQQMNMSDGPRFWGKFVCKGLEPTEEELVDAEERLRVYLTYVVEVADRMWSANPKHDAIDSRCKIAADFLGIKDKPWLSTVRAETELIECPMCLEKIKAGAKLCRFCHSEFEAVPGVKTRKRKEQAA